MSNTTALRSAGDESAADAIANGVFRWSLGLLTGIAALSTVFAVGVARNGGMGLRIGTASVGLGLAAILVGAFLGLLFGMPRSIERAADAEPVAARFASNTNLLKVSDWLTTIIVGLTLVSLGGVPAAVDAYSSAIAPALGNRSFSGPFGVFITIVGLVGGFILAYVWTIIALRSHLEQSERDADLVAGTLLRDAASGKLTERELKQKVESSDERVLNFIQQRDPRRVPAMLQEVVREELDRRSE